ncbi:MAG: alpha/beta hydrolase [Chloroflexota bacterium]|nr:MAG: alpha/beta hydrolase [Chloroflexota bacterium]
MASWKADDDSLIYFERLGRTAGREKLLLLPGLLGTIGSQWRSFVEPLSERYELILADLRGHGRSENNDLHLLPEQMVEDLIGLLDHLSVQSVHVAGYDFGGYLGLMLALYRPRLVNTLLMHGTKFFWSQQAAAEMRRQLNPEHISREAPSYANRLSAEHGANRWRPLVRQAADLITYLSEKPLGETALRRVQAPILVSVGDRDELIPVQEAYRLSRTLEDASLLVVPGAHHPFRSSDLIPLLPVMEKFQRR